MTNYYFLASALPPLKLGFPPEISFREVSNLLHDNLTQKDFAQSQVIRRFYDIQNIRAFWRGEELDPRGNLSRVDLEEAVISREGLPGYVYDYLDAFDTREERLKHFPSLVGTFFNREQASASGFLKRYLEFEREWRLVFTGFRAKQLGRDLVNELQFEDPNDDFVAQILAQKDAKTFIPPDGYEELQVLFEEHENNPLQLYQALCEYRFYAVEEMMDINLFSIDHVLGYLVQLIILEKWQELNKQKGLDIVKQVVNY